MLDYGLSPTFDVDWVDHIRPASKGGGNEIENGVCASHFYNSKKNNNSRDSIYLFTNGLPTADFYYFYEVVPLEVATHLARFARAHPSDWYFNRAAQRFMHGVEWIISERNGGGYKRDDVYYSKAAMKMLVEWRRKSHGLADFEHRGLVSKIDLSEDQRILLSLSDCSTVTDVLSLMRRNWDWYQNGILAMDALSDAETDETLAECVAHYCSISRLPKRVTEILKSNESRLAGKLGSVAA